MKFKWDKWSWKGQLKRTRSWKVLSWKVWSWKEPSEVGKNRLKLEWRERSWKEPTEVGKTFQLKTFQLLVLSNCLFLLHVSRSSLKVRKKLKWKFKNWILFSEWMKNYGNYWKIFFGFYGVVTGPICVHMFENFVHFLGNYDAEWLLSLVCYAIFFGNFEIHAVIKMPLMGSTHPVWVFRFETTLLEQISWES